MRKAQAAQSVFCLESGGDAVPHQEGGCQEDGLPSAEESSVVAGAKRSHLLQWAAFRDLEERDPLSSLA